MEKKKGFWSVGRLIIGIVLMLLAMFVLFQSCAAGMVNTLDDTDDVGGTAGLIVAIFMIVSGIIAICTRNSESKAGPIIVTVLLAIAALLAFCNSAVFSDLVVWGVVCAAFAVVFIICAVKTRRNGRKKYEE